ncbi:TPA: hypothetical protein JDY72_27625, partial [Citrobacter freundii]|nr:hypothetical protein [Citrobacter freundii]
MLLNKLTVEKFHSIMESILERLEKDDYLSWDFINRLSKNGWVPPLAFDCYDYFQCPSSELSDKEIELGFMSFFELNFESVFLKIINLEEKQNPFIHKMLLEVIQAYRQGFYQICIPSLFAILERHLADLSNDGDLSNVKYSMGLARKVWIENDENGQFIENDSE